MRRSTRATTQARPGAWEQPNAARTTDQATYGLANRFRQDTSATVASGRASPRRSAVLPTSPAAPGRSRVAERAEGNAGGRPDVERCATRPRRTTVRTRHRVRTEHRASPARSAPQTRGRFAAKGYDHLRRRHHPHQHQHQHGPKVRIARRGTEDETSLGRHRWLVERTVSWLLRCARLGLRSTAHSHCAPAAHLGLCTDCLASTRAARVVRPGLSTSPRAVARTSCHGPRPTV